MQASKRTEVLSVLLFVTVFASDQLFSYKFLG